MNKNAIISIIDQHHNVQYPVDLDVLVVLMPCCLTKIFRLTKMYEWEVLRMKVLLENIDQPLKMIDGAVEHCPSLERRVYWLAHFNKSLTSPYRSKIIRKIVKYWLTKPVSHPCRRRRRRRWDFLFPEKIIKQLIFLNGIHRALLTENYFSFFSH